MSTPDPVDVAFNKFLHTVEDRHVRQARIARLNEEIVLQKNKHLIPLRKLLKRLMDLNLVVTNSARHAGGIVSPNTAPVSLQVHEGDSSPTWAPGISLFLEHPAELEIAVPNEKDVKELGLVVIRCSTHHPDSSLFNGPFHTSGAACEALAEFLARNTQHMNRQEV